MFTSKNLYKIIIALAVLFIVFLVLRDNNYFGLFVNNKAYETQIATRKSNNVGACKREALKQLKSPGSARFGEDWEYVGNISSDTFKTENYVDSQNSFGALLRSNFVCSVVGGEVFIMLDSDEPNLHDQYETRAGR